jgi:hypothetical protein
LFTSSSHQDLHHETEIQPLLVSTVSGCASLSSSVVFAAYLPEGSQRFWQLHQRGL